MPVTAIIPHWNRQDLLDRVLTHLGAQTLPFEEIVVVDNGSTDNSVALARSRGAKVLEMGRNTGFSPAVNRGLQEVRTPWVAIVNNDVQPEPEWAERLLETAARTESWFATGKLLDAARPDRLEGTFDLLSRAGHAWRAGCGSPDAPEWNREIGIRFTPFTAALFRRALFERVGLLDERFESYFEDVDFGLRCAAQGVGGVYVPSARAYHAGSATLGEWHQEKVRRMARNQLYLLAKHYPGRLLWRWAWPILAAQFLWGGVALRHGRGGAFVKGKLQGIAAFARRGKPLPGLAGILEESEAQLRELQKSAGWDTYWRWYFRLT